MKNTYMKTDCIKNDLKASLSKNRYRHTENVIVESARLARIYGADVEKAKFIALIHDRFRDVDDETLNELITGYGMDPVYNNNNALAHGPLAAAYYKDKFDIIDDEILNSVRYHTTGRQGMGLQEKIIFLADAIEKDRCYDGVERIRSEAAKDIDRGVEASLENTVDHLNKQNRYIDNNTLKALEYIRGGSFDRK